MIRTRTSTWTVQRLTPCGWVDVEHSDNPAPRFSVIVQIYAALPTYERRILRDGRPLSTPTNPTLFDS